MINCNSHVDIINAAYIRLFLFLLASAKSPEQYDALIDYYVFDDQRPEKYKNKDSIKIDKGKLLKLAFLF